MIIFLCFLWSCFDIFYLTPIVFVYKTQSRSQAPVLRFIFLLLNCFRKNDAVYVKYHINFSTLNKPNLLTQVIVCFGKLSDFSWKFIVSDYHIIEFVVLEFI